MMPKDVVIMLVVAALLTLITRWHVTRSCAYAERYARRVAARARYAVRSLTRLHVAFSVCRAICHITLLRRR